MEEEAKVQKIQKPNSKLLVLMLTVSMFLAACILVFFLLKVIQLRKQASTDPLKKDHKITSFLSSSDFLEYYNQSLSQLNGVSVGEGVSIDQSEDANIALSPVVPAIGQELREKVVESSKTNIQVTGVDEADIVKTNGSEIFYSSLGMLAVPRLIERDIMSIEEPSVDVALPSVNSETKVITAYPSQNLKLRSTIDKNGELLLYKDILVVISGNQLFAHDVSDPDDLEKKWELLLDSNQEIITVRRIESQLYILTRSMFDKNRPCPIPLSENGMVIDCKEIYHPEDPVAFDSTFNLIKVNADTGDVDKKVSFIASTYLSVSYFSRDFAYISYTEYKNTFNYLYEFFISDGKVLFDSEFANKLDKVKDLDISLQAKLTEFQVLMEEKLSSLGPDEQLTFQNNFENLLAQYGEKHVREIETSTLVKIDLTSMQIDKTGTVPGRPLNQFSLDEFEGNLRIATTVGLGSLTNVEDLNDLYVLDKSMDMIGSVTGLAKGERIYSARFLGNIAYVVTFKQIDPFFVIDLSDAKNPKVAGELKIPGYSSYLHPLEDGLVLGVGMDENQVKLSLFEVTNPSSPKEVSKYILDEYWTEVNNNHKAFLLDSKNKTFFIPGGKGGYLFSYIDNQISLEKSLAEPGINRAVYIENYWYMLSPSRISIVEKGSFETVSSLAL